MLAAPLSIDDTTLTFVYRDHLWGLCTWMKRRGRRSRRGVEGLIGSQPSSAFEVSEPRARFRFL